MSIAALGAGGPLRMGAVLVAFLALPPAPRCTAESLPPYWKCNGPPETRAHGCGCWDETGAPKFRNQLKRKS